MLTDFDPEYDFVLEPGFDDEDEELQYLMEAASALDE